MLILSREEGQKIIIGQGQDKIEVVVLGFNRGQVKLGVAAPYHVPVHREEIHDRILAEGGDL